MRALRSGTCHAHRYPVSAGGRQRGARRPRGLPARANKEGAQKAAPQEPKEGSAKVGPPPPATSGNGAKQPTLDDDGLDAAEAAQQRSNSELLLAAIQDGNTDEAEQLADAVVKDQEGLVAAVEQAEAKAKQAQKTLDQLKDQYRRLQADFDNFRSRADQEKKQTGRNIKKGVLQDMLPMIDNFESAASKIQTQTEGEEKINKSYQGLYRGMVDSFKAMGLQAVPTVGAQFDPNVHDAIQREEVTDQPDGVVLEEYRKGFMFEDQLLRAAMVKVAANSSMPAEPAATGSDSGSDAAAKSGSDSA